MVGWYSEFDKNIPCQIFRWLWLIAIEFYSHCCEKTERRTKGVGDHLTM
jgi:hypothetical protein